MLHFSQWIISMLKWCLLLTWLRISVTRDSKNSTTKASSTQIHILNVFRIYVWLENQKCESDQVALDSYLCYLILTAEQSCPPYAFAETSPKRADSLAGGSHPASLLLCADIDHWLDLHGANGKEEAAIRGCLQPQCPGTGGSSPGNGQHAQSPTRRKAHMTQN